MKARMPFSLSSSARGRDEGWQQEGGLRGMRDDDGGDDVTAMRGRRGAKGIINQSC